MTTDFRLHLSIFIKSHVQHPKCWKKLALLKVLNISSILGEDTTVNISPYWMHDSHNKNSVNHSSWSPTLQVKKLLWDYVGNNPIIQHVFHDFLDYLSTCQPSVWYSFLDTGGWSNSMCVIKVWDISKSFRVKTSRFLVRRLEITFLCSFGCWTRHKISPCILPSSTQTSYSQNQWS